MGYLRGIGVGGVERAGKGACTTPGIEQRRRAVSSGQLGVGSLACARCDAPVALGGPHAVTDELACPYCAHRAPLRDFLTLGVPTRPARVVIRVSPVRRRA